MPHKYPATVIPAWNTANIIPILSTFLIEHVFIMEPLVTDTARLSIDSPMANKMISNIDIILVFSVWKNFLGIGL